MLNFIRKYGKEWIDGNVDGFKMIRNGNSDGWVLLLALDHIPLMLLFALLTN